jgi:PIN domain nuclease of toxin-antitoxin system
MKYLLDTHVILWIAFEEAKISKKVRGILLSEASKLFISAVSCWEISLKYKTGKLDLKHYTPEMLFAGFEQNFECQKLNLEIIDAISFFQLEQTHHKDPFDRMLIWQALQNDLAFISDDENIKLYRDAGLKVIW